MNYDKLQLFIFGTFLCLHTVTSLTCPSGSYIAKDGQEKCEPCAPDTFMPYENHQHRDCYDCMKIEDPETEILISSCTPKQEAVIHCVEGYYRQLRRLPHDKERCRKCTKCSNYDSMYTIRECQTYNDTLCCSGENYLAVLNAAGEYQCHELPWLCTRGYYFDADGHRECRQCPPGYFMPFEYHAMRECIKCPDSSDIDLPRMSVVHQECNTTHTPVIGCKDGYFLDRSAGRRSHGTGCSPCRNCTDEGRFEGEHCKSDQDSVCCDEPNMSVVRDSDGVRKCVQAGKEEPVILRCPDSFCIHKMNSRAVRCEPCSTTVRPDPKSSGETEEPSTKSQEIDSQNKNSTRPTLPFEGEHSDESHRIIVGILVSANSIIVIIIICLCCKHRIKRYVDGCWSWLRTLITGWRRRAEQEGEEIMPLIYGHPRQAESDSLVFRFTLEDFDSMSIDDVIYSPFYKFKSPNSHRVQGGVVKTGGSKLKLNLLVSPDPRDHGLRWPAEITWKVFYVVGEKTRPLQGETQMTVHGPDECNSHDLWKNGIDIDVESQEMVHNNSITLMWVVNLAIPTTLRRRIR